MRRFARAAGKVGGGFTLLEVLLAVVIASGLFLAVLSFYRQTADTRQAVSEQLDAVGDARRVMQHLTAELRAAAHHDAGHGMSGSSQQIRFATTTLPAEGRRNTSGLILVNYAVQRDGEDRPVGLTRAEQPASPASSSVTEAGEEDSPDMAEEEGDPLLDMFGEGDDAAGDGLDEAEAEGATSAQQQGALVLTERLRFMRFRYWDGSAWSESWQGPELPGAVEIMLAAEPVPEELSPEEYAQDVYRRTVNVGYTVPGEVDEFAEDEDEDQDADADPLGDLF
ncbi:MAG: hypothetical protein WD294_14370 [Phycisphaeraceae bacterium]